MKKLAFLAGLVSGCVLALNWKSVTKQGIKAGIKAGRKVREVSRQALDDIEDVAAEAMDELAREEQGAAK
jgi:hypothetical protein